KKFVVLSRDNILSSCSMSRQYGKRGAGARREARGNGQGLAGAKIKAKCGRSLCSRSRDCLGCQLSDFEICALIHGPVGLLGDALPDCGACAFRDSLVSPYADRGDAPGDRAICAHRADWYYNLSVW